MDTEVINMDCMVNMAMVQQRKRRRRRMNE
jgi:hypothetical protein